MAEAGHTRPAPAVRVRRRRARTHAVAYLLAGPILIYEAVFVLYPIIQGVQLSLTNASLGDSESSFVGVKNYDRLFHDPNFYANLRNTLTYAVAVVVIAVGVGLMTAVLVNRRFRGRGLVRGIMTAPWAFPEIATVLIFIWIMNPTFGVINVISNIIPGLDGSGGWLTSSPLALVSIVLISTWKTFPFYSIVILASLQTVPEELDEAARVDGANAVRRFWHVTLPSIRPTLILLSLLAFIFAFRQFSLIWLTTGGGPGRDTETLVVAIYNTAFKFYDYSYGATIGVASLVVTLVVTLAILAVQRRYQEED
jgi:multiple sugar transport system permease protein